MKVALNRDNVDGAGRNRRRVVIILLVAAAGWWAGRDALLLALARDSVGAASRAELIAAAVTRLHPDFPVSYWNSQDPQLTSNLKPSAGVAWTSGATGSRRQRYVFSDGALNLAGSLSSARLVHSGPACDHDGDGRFEVIQLVNVPHPMIADRGYAWGAVRLGQGGEPNELVGAVLMKLDRRWYYDARWRDWDEDGANELVFTRKPSARRQSTGNVVAVFGWTGPGGVLRAERPSDDENVQLWLPQPCPYPFSPDTDLASFTFP